MSKTVWRFRPGDYWRIGEHESWFSDMAAEGLHLAKMGLIFARFDRGEPKKVRYRIDTTPDSSSNSDLKELYADSGWEFVTGFGEFKVYSSLTEANATELHTDPAEQAYSLQELNRKLFRNVLIVAIYAVMLMVILSTPVWLPNGTTTLTLIEGTSTFILLAISVVYLLYDSVSGAISMRVLRKSLTEGKPIDHRAPWKKQQKISTAVGLIYFVILAYVVVMPFLQMAFSETYDLPEIKTELPIVRLGDVENNPDLVRQNSSDVDRRINIYTKKWSLLAPVQIQSHEYGKVPNMKWNDNSGIYSPSIHTRFYQLRVSNFSKSLVSDLIKRYGQAYNGEKYNEIEHADFDLLFLNERDGNKEIYAAKGKMVMHIKYYGHADMETFIKAISNMMNEL